MDDPHKVLIVDDEIGIQQMLTRALAARGFTCHAEGSSLRALARVAREDYAVVITDLRVPDLDGIELLKRVKACRPFTEVIIITGVFELSSGVEAMRCGAYDYVTKPFAIETIALTVDRALRARDLEIQSQRHKRQLEAEVELRTLELLESNQRIQQIFLSMLKTLANTLEAKDPYTRGHSDRVAAHAVAAAAHLEFPAPDLSRLELAGLLHDIGKIGVREAVLHKPGRLTDEEYEHIKAHTVLGERILGPVGEFASILDYVRHHHERVDGGGYPDGLCGDELSLGAKILCACDAYDAMTSDRPYRAAYSHEHACEEIQRCAGTQFDPVVAEVFLEVFGRDAVQAPAAP